MIIIMIFVKILENSFENIQKNRNNKLQTNKKTRVGFEWNICSNI